MPRDFSKEFFATYHAAVFEALGKDAVRYNARIGIMLANLWLERLKTIPANTIEFKAAIEAFMNGPFRFSDIAEMSFNNDGTASLYIKGCDICPGNELLRNNGDEGHCPISQMIKSALGKTLKKRIELLESEKPGPMGECYLKYKTSE